MQATASHYSLKGNSYEIGRTLGRLCKSYISSHDSILIKEPYLTKEDELQMCKLFDEFCPGINDEIKGFAEVLNVPPVQVLYYAETYLCPGCSQIVLLPSVSANGHMLLARNYDFKDGIEEMSIITTKVDGKNAHVASSAWIFGRGDGINDKGLAVSQSGVGIPVTRNMANTSRAAIKGLQFWAVIRTVLENCSSVDEAIKWTKDMPIAFNINMIVADKNGNAALIETFDGRKAVKKIGIESSEQYLCATNHAHLPELKQYTPMVLRNSVSRQSIIDNFVSGKSSITTEDLEWILSEQYPVGLNCRYYDYFFGTLRSQIIDINEGTMSVRWGTPGMNEWSTYRIDDEECFTTIPVKLIKEAAPDDFYKMISL